MIFRVSPMRAWVAILVSGLIWNPLSGYADDNCKVCAAKSAKCCDNKGILDALDVFAGKLHSKLISNKTSCDNAPDCGCEAKATCGCEMRPACGCEIKPGCGCEVNSPASSLPLQQLEFVAPDIVRPVAQPRPEPLPLTNPTVEPLPDTKVDPFRDDAASRIRKVPARPVQFRGKSSSGSASRYGETFDPQASNRRHVPGSRIALNGSAEDGKRSYSSLTAGKSSRRKSTQPKASVLKANSIPSPKVIPASAAKPLKTAGGDAPILEKNAASEFHNPLR